MPTHKFGDDFLHNYMMEHNQNYRFDNNFDIHDTTKGLENKVNSTGLFETPEQELSRKLYYRMHPEEALIETLKQEKAMGKYSNNTGYK